MWRKEKWTWRMLAVAILAIASKQAWASNPVDATITVTPVATVDLAIAPTTYAFGSLDIGVSTVTVSALTLTNNGTVDVTVAKKIQTESNPVGWTAATIASPNNGADKYALFVSTAATRPAVGDFVNSDHMFDGTNSNALKGLGGATPVVTTSAGSLPNVELWFRLDMPTSVTGNEAREITVRFTGTAQ